MFIGEIDDQVPVNPPPPPVGADGRLGATGEMIVSVRSKPAHPPTAAASESTPSDVRSLFISPTLLSRRLSSPTDHGFDQRSDKSVVAPQPPLVFS
jgi:hypothetical protein